MQGYRFKAKNFPTYCINAETPADACSVFVKEQIRLGFKETVHVLGYCRKQHDDIYIVADYYQPAIQKDSLTIA